MNRNRTHLLRQLWWLSAIAVLVLPGFASAQLHTEKLELVRDRIVFPEMTAQQKRDLAIQTQLFLRDMYAHRYHKPKYYEDSGVPDAGRAIQAIVDRAEQLPVPELQMSLNRLFATQRDLHLNFYYPAPYNLFKSFIPMTLARTAEPRNFFEVRVASVNADQMAQFAPGQRVPAIGDEVIRYNGRAILEEIKSLAPVTQGANEYGAFDTALEHLTLIQHRRRNVPELNQVTLDMKALSNGQTYRIVLPWIAQWTEPLPAPGPALRKVSPVKRFELGVNDDREEYNAFIKANRLERASVYPSNPSSEPVLTWGKITNSDGTFGYLRLQTMSPVNGSVAAIAEIRRLLMGELAKTDGLIFDVRDNGGGDITLSDRLVQLFSRTEAKVNGFRLLNSDVNRRIFNESIFGSWYPEHTKAINAVAGTDRIYSDPVPFVTDINANLIGQVYYKPVALLSSAGSYSATDEFVCSMQDNGGALIYGQDPKTGAGGANVWEHTDFEDYGPVGMFPPVPLNQRMRVSWRQSVRTGPNAGKVIEDYGCSANFDISMTASDLVTGNARQLGTVTHSLAQLSKLSLAYARGEQSEAEIYLARSSMSYGIYVAQTPYVDVYVNDVKRARITVKTPGVETLVRYTLPSDLTGGQAHRLNFVGVNGAGQRLWNLKRRVTLLDQKVALGTGGLLLDFATAANLSPMTVINQGSAAKDGWNLVQPNLQVGYAPGYVDYVDTDAVLFLDLRGTPALTLEFGLELDTELDYDFIEVAVTNNASKTTLLRTSGLQSLAFHTFDLSAFAGQDNVALHFRFTSDTNTTATGVRIPRITLR